MGAGWTCLVLSDAGDIEVEQLDEAGNDWYAAGPGGERIGRLEPTVSGAAGDSVDPAWLAVVTSTIARDRIGPYRSMLSVKRGQGTWFHASFCENRESIARHGLDWTRMTQRGIAGSTEPETDGVFLCADLESAEGFVMMGRRHGGSVDIWAATLDGEWLIADPSASGGIDDFWMICGEPIPPTRLTLFRADARPWSSSDHG